MCYNLRDDFFKETENLDMIYPEFPAEGSVLGICAPSAGVGYKLDYFNKSLGVLMDAGYELYETESVRNDEKRHGDTVKGLLK